MDWGVMIVHVSVAVARRRLVVDYQPEYTQT